MHSHALRACKRSCIGQVQTKSCKRDSVCLHGYARACDMNRNVCFRGDMSLVRQPFGSRTRWSDVLWFDGPLVRRLIDSAARCSDRSDDPLVRRPVDPAAR